MEKGAQSLSEVAEQRADLRCQEGRQAGLKQGLRAGEEEEGCCGAGRVAFSGGDAFGCLRGYEGVLFARRRDSFCATAFVA